MIRSRPCKGPGCSAFIVFLTCALIVWVLTRCFGLT